MMELVSVEHGAKCMRQWGLEDWPDVEADYWVWDGCCAFAIMRHGDIADLHMAMDPRRRRDCAKAMHDMLDILSADEVAEVRALIEESRAKVCSFAIKMGFRFNSKFTGVSHDGAVAKVIDMRKSLWVG